MSPKLVLLVLLSAGTNSHCFEVVSTTEKQQQDSQSSCLALNYRLLAIEAQNSQFQKFLDQQYKLNDKTLSQLIDVTARLINSSNLAKVEEKTPSCHCELTKVTEEITLQLQKITEKVDAAFSSLEKKVQAIEQQIIAKINETEDTNRTGTVDNWIYVLKRFDGSQDFNLSWNEYKNGFGSPKGELWLGLERLYELTNAGDYELTVKIVTEGNKSGSVSYKRFKIGPESEGYPLKSLEGYSGDVGDGLSPLLNLKFSTYDKDQDGATGTNCALFYKGGWWFDKCYIGAGFLTGAHKKVDWLPTNLRNIEKAEMMIRPRKS